MTIRTYIEDVMYGRTRSLFIEGLLLPVSFAYGIALRVRNALYALRILTKESLPCRVISVGNLTIGGTGKTPTVIQIADFLLKSKRYPAVVSRGYGRKNEADIVAVSDGKAPLSDTAIAGDEPSLIGSKLPGVPVVVGKDRYRAALFTLQVFGPNTMILDDGFQHVRLQRDLDIVLVDAEDPFGNGRLFPSGILREPLKALKRADVVLITRADRADNLGWLKSVIRGKTRARIFTSRHSPVDLVDIRNSEQRSFSTLRGTAVLAFSGIARPASFTALLRSLGADIKYGMTYPDHYVYKKEDMAAIFQKAGDVKATMIITTEKDAVRLKALDPEGIWALRIELKVVEEEEWEKVVLGIEQRALLHALCATPHAPCVLIMNKAVFLDRDGTVTEEVGYLTDLEKLRLIPGAGRAIKKLNQAGFKVVLVTNQSGVARGYFSESLVQKAHDRLTEMLRHEGAALDGIYYCPHHPTAGESEFTMMCECRKPGTGLLDKAADDLAIDLHRSYVVGDKWSDIELAHRAGARAVLVRTGFATDDPGNVRPAHVRDPDLTAHDLGEAAEWIVRQGA